MEFLRKAVKVGNSAGVILPKKLLGSEVKVTVMKRPVNIKMEVIKLTNQYFSDISGIYIISKKPIEVIAVTSKQKKIIKSGKIKISLVPLSLIKKDLKLKPELKQKIVKAEVILNPSLLKKLKNLVRN